MRRKEILLNIAILGICGIFYFPGRLLAQVPGPDNVRMSYQSEGGHASRVFVSLEINGDGKAVYGFKNLPAEPLQTEQILLNRQVTGKFIQAYAALKFLDYDFTKITNTSGKNYVIYDAPYQTLSFQDKAGKRTARYQTIKTKEQGNTLVPADAEAQKLLDLQNLYWSVISRQDYLRQLKNYRSTAPGELANLLSSLEADVKKGGLYQPRVFVPLIMEIISQKKMRDSVGQYAAGALQAITGENPPGDWYDSNRWLAWWPEHKGSYEKN